MAPIVRAMQYIHNAAVIPSTKHVCDSVNCSQLLQFEREDWILDNIYHYG